MKKIFIGYILFVFATSTNAQTTYDVFTYTELKGYKKELKSDFVSYTKSDTKAGTYCIISLYKQSPSSGDLMKDFDNDWQSLIAKPFNVTAPSQKDNGDEITGWKTYSGAANFEFGGGTSMVILTTAKKDDANIAIVVITNAQTFLTTDVDAFFGAIKLGNPMQTAVKQKNVATENNDNINGKPASLLGEWYLSDGNAKITLLFGANGQYDKGSLVDRRIISNLYETTTIKGKGTYNLNGSTLILSPATGSKEVYQIRFSTYTDSEGKPSQILHLKRPIDGGQMYESDYYLVTKQIRNTASNSNGITNQINNINTQSSANSNTNFGTGKMDGVWVAYFLSYVTKGMMFDHKVFLSNGRFLNDMPIGGLDDFTPNEMNPLYTYTLNNNNGKYIDAANKYLGTFTIKAPNKIELESHTYFKSANPNGKFINASYTSWDDENSSEFKAAPKGDRPVIHFYGNGKFEDEGIFKHLRYSDPTKKAGKGSYNIKNYTLYLTYDDGRPIQKFSIATFGESTQFEEAKIIMIYGGHFFKIKNK